MRISKYLCVKYNPEHPNISPVARLMTLPPALRSQEIAIKLSIDIPDDLFIKPQLEASIVVPVENVNPPMIEADVLDNIEEVVRKTLGVDMSISLIVPTEAKP